MQKNVKNRQKWPKGGALSIGSFGRGTLHLRGGASALYGTFWAPEGKSCTSGEGGGGVHIFPQKTSKCHDFHDFFRNFCIFHEFFSNFSNFFSLLAWANGPLIKHRIGHRMGKPPKGPVLAILAVFGGPGWEGQKGRFWDPSGFGSGSGPWKGEVGVGKRSSHQVRVRLVR